MSPQLKIEPTRTDELDFPGAYPCSPSSFEQAPSCLDAARQYFPSQQDLHRIAHNTIRGYIHPYPATQQATPVSPIEESETTPTTAGSFVLINRGASVTPTSTSTRGNHDDSIIQPDIKDNDLEPHTHESPLQAHPASAKGIAVPETQVTVEQPDTHTSECAEAPKQPTNADHDRNNKVDTNSRHTHSSDNKESQSQQGLNHSDEEECLATGEPTGLGIRVVDVKNTSATETNMQKVFSSTATTGHEEEEEEEMHLNNFIPSTSQIEQNPKQTEQSYTSYQDQRSRKKGNFLNKIRDWSRRDRKTKPRTSD